MRKRTDIDRFSGLSAHSFAEGQLYAADNVRLCTERSVRSLGTTVDFYSAQNRDLLSPGVYTTDSCYDPDYETPVTKDWIFSHIAPKALLGAPDSGVVYRFLVAKTTCYGKNENGYRQVVAAFCHGDELCIFYTASMNFIEERGTTEVDGYTGGMAAQFDATYNETDGTGVFVRTLTHLLLDRYLPDGSIRTQLVHVDLHTHQKLTGKAETHRTMVQLKNADVFHYVTHSYAPAIGGSYAVYFDTVYTTNYPTLSTDYPLYTVDDRLRMRKAGFCLPAGGASQHGVSRRFLLLPEMLTLYGGESSDYMVNASTGTFALNAGVQLFGRLYGITDTEVHASENGTVTDFTTPAAAETDDPDAAWCDTVKGADEAFTAITAFDGKVIVFTAHAMLTVRGTVLPFELSYIGAYGCLSAEAVAAHEKYLYFVSASGVMRYDGTHVAALDAPPAPDKLWGAALTVMDDALLLHVPGDDSLYIYDTKGGGWSRRSLPGGTAVLFPGDNRESAHFCNTILQNTGSGFRPVRLFAPGGSFSLAVAVPFAGRRRLYGIGVTAALGQGAVLSVCGADGSALHSFAGTDGTVRTYFAAAGRLYLDSGTICLSGSGDVRIFALSVLSEDKAVLRRRTDPQKNTGGTQT